MFAGMIKGVLEDIYEKYVKPSFVDGHHRAFESRIPEHIRKKLTQDDVQQLGNVSLEIMKQAVETIKARLSQS